MPELLEELLKPSESINSLDQRIVNQVSSLAGKCMDKKCVIEILFRFVRDSIIYEDEAKNRPLWLQEYWFLVEGIVQKKLVFFRLS